MKVLILTTVRAPYRVNLFNELGKYCDLTVCFEQKKDLSRDDKWYENTDTNYKFVVLDGWEKSLKSVKFSILKEVTKFSPDVVIAYEYSTNTAMLLMLYCKLKGIPYIINCDGAFINKSYKDIAKKHFIKNAKGLIASGKMAHDYFLNYGADESKIFYNNFTSLYKNDILESIPTENQKNNYRKTNNIYGEKVVVSVGQFIHRKGFDILLKAALKLDKNISYYLIGGKPTEEYLSFVNENELKNVYFLDFMSPEKLREYYIASDLFVLPTREDVWGLVINEAMACGLPVITTNKCVAGLELIKNGENGYIVPVDDYNALVGRINDIFDLGSNNNEMKNNCIETIKDYTYEKSAEMIYNILEKFDK